MVKPAFKFLHQPKAFYLVFSIEIWERFGFGGLQALLVVYMIHKLGMPSSLATNTFSAFSALLYSFACFGGYIGDRILGIKRTIMLSVVIIASGYFTLGYANTDVLFFGLATVAVGCALFKANPPNLLAKAYHDNDTRFDTGYTLYYMAVNIGAGCGLFFVPLIADNYGWGVGFWVCATGLVAALINFYLGKFCIKQVGAKPDFKPINYLHLVLVIIGLLLAIFITHFILLHLQIAYICLAIITLYLIGKFYHEINKASKPVKGKMIVACVLMIEATFFFILYQQMPTSLNLFALYNVKASLFNYSIDPKSLQALNTAWIVIASPILAWYYQYLQNKGRNFPITQKFCSGMLSCACGFLIFSASTHFANPQGFVSVYWIVIGYGFQSIGELLISGIGLSMIAQLMPKHLHGFTMGAWFLTSTIAFVLGGFVANLASLPNNKLSPLLTLEIYDKVFLEIGLTTFIIAVIMFIIAPKLNRMLHQHDTSRR